jgi:hypothetical protein
VDFEELRREAEKQLIEFLRTDLELARIFVDSASRQLKRANSKTMENYSGKPQKQSILSITLVKKSPIRTSVRKSGMNSKNWKIASFLIRIER